MKKQQKHRYVSLITHIAITLLATHGLMYLFGRLLNFVYTVAYVSYGNVFLVDIIFFIVDCVKYVACLIIPLKLFSYLRRNAFHEKVLPEDHEKAPVLTVIAILLLGVAANWISAWSKIIANESLFSYMGENEEYILGSQLIYGYQIVIYIISTAILPAIVEEYVFRHIICRSLLPYGPKTAVFISAVLFGLMHVSIQKIGFTFIAGIFLGWIYVASKDIKMSIIFHFVHNFMCCVSTIIAVKVSPTDASLFVVKYATVLCFVGIIALVYLLAKRNKENEKLVMLTDEEGVEGKLLSLGERITGFFSPVMIVFVVATLVQMYYYLSFSLV